MIEYEKVYSFVFHHKLHQEHGPVASFWFGPQFCVSVGSVSAFKDIQYLFDRPSKLYP